MQNARDSIAVDNNAATSGDSRVMINIQKTHRLFNSISGNFLDKANCGLFFRIERSRYYVALFRENHKRLRIIRLEGDQPYDQFIERRLGRQFDYINRLGIRYERATNSLNMLDQSYLAIKTAMINRSIEEIQAWGEFALLGALVPYYVMHLLDLIIKHNFIPWLSIMVWGAFLALAVQRKFIKKNWAKPVSFCIIFLTIVVGFTKAMHPDSFSWLILSQTEQGDQRSAETQSTRQKQGDSGEDQKPSASHFGENATKSPSLGASVGAKSEPR